MPLSSKSIATLRPGFHADAGNLYLKVSPTGARSWVFRYMRHGKRRDMGLGPVRLLGLADARKKAHDCRELLFQGIDPLDRKQGLQAAQRTATAKAMSFGAA